MSFETHICRQLISGKILCQVTEDEALDWLKTTTGKDVANDALGYCGFKLAYNEEETYFYASYQDLDDREDTKALKNQLQEIVNAMHPIFKFMEFIAQANGEDTYPDIGHIYRFTELLTTVENNEAIADALKALTSTKFFKNARAKTQINERLNSALTIMTSQGLLFSDGSGIKFTVTGKFAYYIQIYLSIIAMQSPEILEAVEAQQMGMALD